MAGYEVDAQDGRVGVVDRVSYSGNCLFISTGHIRKHRHPIPAGAVERIDTARRSIFLSVTKDDVDKSPPYDWHRGFDDDCERKTETYYATLLSSERGEASERQQTERPPLN